jgi:hypothetical protein
LFKICGEGKYPKTFLLNGKLREVKKLSSAPIVWTRATEFDQPDRVGIGWAPVLPGIDEIRAVIDVIDRPYNRWASLSHERRAVLEIRLIE